MSKTGRIRKGFLEEITTGRMAEGSIGKVGGDRKTSQGTAVACRKALQEKTSKATCQVTEVEV